MRNVVVVGLVVLGLLPGTAIAQDGSFGQGADGACRPYPTENGQEQEICTAQVPSFDGTPLDVDLTRPLNESPGKRHPLIVMLHGFGNDKHEWQSLTDEGDGTDKFHWNSHWFAKHGFYVLTYTARGFESREAREHEPKTPAGTSESIPNGKIRLKSRESEVRDTQYLAALAASQFDIHPERVAVTGGSYGGGESWVQASQSEWTWPHDQNPALPKLALQVAVPKYPWTDLAYALAPNGHPGLVGQQSGDPIHESSQAPPTSETGRGNPVGAPKASYLAGLFTTGARRGTYEDGASNQIATTEGPINILEWQERIFLADPYRAEDPTIAQILRGLTEFRSAYYQDRQWAAQADGRKVAIFSIQGWTDDLFHAVESFRMFKYLKRLDPKWPVAVEVADIGHSRGQNRPEQWQRLNKQAFQFLQAHINGSREQETTVASEPTICAADGDPDRNLAAAMRITARSPEALSNGRLIVGLPGGELTNESGAGDPNGPRTDPVLGGPFDSVLFGDPDPCRASDSPALTGYTATSAPLRSTSTYVGLGSVTLPYTLAGISATLHARVWDVPPTGPTRLVTRGTYRLENPEDPPLTGQLRLPLFGNHWQFRPGHRVRVDLVEVDAGTFRPTDAVNTVTFTGATLELPTRDAGDTRLTATGGMVPTP